MSESLFYKQTKTGHKRQHFLIQGVLSLFFIEA